MKTTAKMMCCLMFGCVVMVTPSKVKAQSDNDKNFLATVEQGGQNEIKLSELAEEKATNPAVKAFAEKMVKEHKEMADGLKPFVESWGMTAPTGPDDEHQKEWNKLNGMSGADFDKEYISQMVTDHTKALDAFTKEAKETKDPKFRAVVLKDKSMVAAHKNMAYDLKKKL